MRLINAESMKSLRNIFRKEEPQPEEMAPDVLAHALQSLDTGVTLGFTDPEERDEIICSIITPKLEKIEQAINDKMNKRRFL